MYRMLIMVAIGLVLVTTSACNRNDCLKPGATAADSESPTQLQEQQPATQTEVQRAETTTAVPATGQQQIESANYTTHILYVALPARYGTVVIPHALHANMLSCNACHGDTVPGKINLNSRAYHSMCRTCHKAMQAGPTRCRGCHTRNK